jgi:hypothetical protein
MGREVERVWYLIRLRSGYGTAAVCGVRELPRWEVELREMNLNVHQLNVMVSRILGNARNHQRESVRVSCLPSLAVSTELKMDSMRLAAWVGLSMGHMKASPCKFPQAVADGASLS